MKKDSALSVVFFVDGSSIICLFNHDSESQIAVFIVCYVVASASVSATMQVVSVTTTAKHV